MARKWNSKKRTWEEQLKDKLTDNVKANEVLSPLYFILVTSFLHFSYLMPLKFETSFKGAIYYALISTLVYLYASNYYQPDLDVQYNRPGMGHFPLGRWIGAFKFGRFLKWFLYPLNRAWFWLWHPYAKLVTHRGVTHYPIIGVWLRTAYLYLWYLFFDYFSQLFNFRPIALDYFHIWLKAFFPWDKNFLSIFWVLFCFPIYLSDVVHWAVDYYDSVRRGLSFCPPKIPRGLVIQTINFLKGRKL